MYGTLVLIASVNSGETLTINKQGTEPRQLAYVGHDFVADGVAKEMADIQDMTSSDTISITNNATGVRKVGMLWK